MRWIQASLADALIVVGSSAVLVGIYLLLGTAWTCITGGLLVAGYGVMGELRWR